jgi:hypothetical protein
MNCLFLPKRDLFPPEPPQAAHKFPTGLPALPGTIRADGKKKNDGKSRENILTASPFLRKVTSRLLRA